ncbi:MAG: amino acid adenylation domain-containing protein [Chloroflexota bacterium]
MTQLQNLVSMSAKSNPNGLAIVDTHQSVTYAQLDGLANQMVHALQAQGIRLGDRVGIWLHKSVYGVVAMQAVLRLGAAYVPLDPLCPPSRVMSIVQDCQLKVLVTTRTRTQQLGQDLASTNESIGYVFISDSLDGTEESQENWCKYPSHPAPIEIERDEDRLAYILYTSGSTGKPKGVCISHRNALAFVRWAVEELNISADDRLANHAPFHFDLSVFDLYAAFMSGASVYLFAEDRSYVPGRLVEFLTTHQITIWYSVPSVLVMMIEDGGLLELESLSLRHLIFAGEPFSIKHLRQLFERWSPMVRFFNFYGPTETNVCTYYEVKTLSCKQQSPVPIGRACSGNHVWAANPEGSEVSPGEEGNLMVSGPTVMLGYWGAEPQQGQTYSTGDRVKQLADGNYLFLGRLDQQVKVRGHRIELGDVETVLDQHPAIKEVAVVVRDSGLAARLLAFFVNDVSTPSPTLLELKCHCAQHLPRHMIIDTAEELVSLPRTSTGKIDRLKLTQDNL